MTRKSEADEGIPLNLFNHHFIDLEGNRLYLDRHRNHPFLVVNIATESRFTPQITQLQRIYTLNQRAGLRILALPCTSFDDEEPRNDSEIAEFLRTEYPVNFLVTARTSVIGIDAHPLFKEILQEFGNHMLPRGNFHKYLFDRKGQLAESWKPHVQPEDPMFLSIINQHLIGL